MIETLEIRNFGPICDMTLQLRKINFFIGDQSTGKSTAAQVLGIVKEMLQLNPDDFKDQESDWGIWQFYEFLEDFGIINYLNKNTYIQLNDSYGSFKFDNQKERKEKIEVVRKERLSTDKITSFGGFIPSNRESAILLKDSLNALALAEAQLPKWFYRFGQILINAKKTKKMYDYTDVLSVKYKYVDDKDMIIMANDKEITMQEASSAINSGVPMLLAFDYFVELMHPRQIRSGYYRVFHHQNRPYIIIEEPEINCFPGTQRKIVNHFIRKLKFETNNGFDFYCGLIITTHSPYFLTSVNNLMYAFTVGKKNQKGASKIINQKYWINPNDVSAYMFKTDGTCEDIFDRKEDLIKSEKIDFVSRELNREFEKLSNLEFAKV